MIKEKLVVELSNFLKSLITVSDWNEAVLNVELQPGVLGMNGSVMFDNGKKESLRTRPNEKIINAIWQLHLLTSTENNVKWNRLRIVINNGLELETEYIWDQEWQDKIDKENRKIKEKNPDYKLPKWSWE